MLSKLICLQKHKDKGREDYKTFTKMLEDFLNKKFVNYFNFEARLFDLILQIPRGMKLVPMKVPVCSMGPNGLMRLYHFISIKLNPWNISVSYLLRFGKGPFTNYIRGQGREGASSKC